jgi:Ca2+:H+ antiporter
MCKLLSAENLPGLLPGDYDDAYALLFLSRGSAIVLLAIYILFLYFRLRSHKYLWASEQDINALDYYDDDDRLGFTMSIVHVAGLAITVVLSLFCTHSLVTSVPAMVEDAHVPLTRTFTGLILLPIITHLCKYIKTTIIAYQGHPEIAVAMTLGSSVDVAFFTLPVLVVVGWVVGKDMTMEFQLLETIIVVLSILVMAGFVMDGKSNYLEGSMSIGL